MKKLKNYIEESLLSDEQELMDSTDENLIRQYLEDNYTIRGSYNIKNGVVNVNGSVSLKNGKVYVFSESEYKNIPNIPLTNGLFKFGRVTGDFICSGSSAKTLEGSPDYVGGKFKCCLWPKLKTLKGAPKEIRGDFYFIECPLLKTLEGGPEKVFGDVYANDCKSLQSLNGVPNIIGGYLYCSDCPKLTDFSAMDKRKSKIQKNL